MYVLFNGYYPWLAVSYPLDTVSTICQANEEFSLHS